MKEYGYYYELPDEEKKKPVFAPPPEQPAQEIQPASLPEDRQEPPAPQVQPAQERPTPRRAEPQPEQTKALAHIYELPTVEVKAPTRSERNTSFTIKPEPIEIFTAPTKSETPDYNSPEYWKESNLNTLHAAIDDGKITNPDVLPAYIEKSYNGIKETTTRLLTSKTAEKNYNGRNLEILSNELKRLDSQFQPEIQGNPHAIRAYTKSQAETALSSADFTHGKSSQADAAKNWLHLGKAYAQKHQPLQKAA